MTDLAKIIESVRTHAKSGSGGLMRITLTPSESAALIVELETLQSVKEDSLVEDTQRIKNIESTVAPEFMAWSVGDGAGLVSEIFAYEDSGVPYFGIRYKGREAVAIRVPAEKFMVRYFNSYE